ncbi:hypothetical protein [Nocardiopsis sp. YSL2]|uniref:hypothetical protein n=1 Tax=Nocardiopsis sp. YSL2 TaxID=2939492 RepID=UPI0026F45709|nr:hypothetical protein [Nocardiopsis sp. YSL2]
MFSEPRRRQDPASFGGYTCRRVLPVVGSNELDYCVTDQDGAWYIARRLDEAGPLSSWCVEAVRERARLIAAVESPRIQSVAAMDLTADRPWTVAPMADGAPLSLHAYMGVRFPASLVRMLATGVAEALVVVHRAGLVHGNLNPDNVYLTRQGPVVGDVVEGPALPRDVHTTDPRLPTEIGPGDPATPACDVFSWGLLVLHASSLIAPGEGDPSPGTPVGDGTAPDGEILRWMREDAEHLDARIAREEDGSVSSAEFLRLAEDEDLRAETDQRFRRFLRTFLDSGEFQALSLSAVPEDLRAVVTAALSPRESERPTAQQLLSALTGAAPDPHRAVQAELDAHWPEVPETLQVKPVFGPREGAVLDSLYLLIGVAWVIALVFAIVFVL